MKHSGATVVYWCGVILATLGPSEARWYVYFLGLAVLLHDTVVRVREAE